MMRAVAVLALGAAALAGCSSRREIAVVPPPTVPTLAIVASPMPLPPPGAAADLVIPARLADGEFATPNRAPGGAAAVWHLRAALNVAALGCDRDGSLAAQYNRLLATHRGAFAAAHRTLQAQDVDGSFDRAMTRLYNYFALPPAQADFCATARNIAAEAAMLPSGAIDGFAPTALARLDAPFVAFFHRYDAYRVALAAWQAGAAPPTLTYDATVFAAAPAPAAERLAAR